VTVTGPVDGPPRDAGRGRVGDTFARLCEIESPSGREAAMAAAVRAELEGMGLVVTEDGTAAETGAQCGNLLTRIPGPAGTRTVMLCSHIDTVPLADRVEVELVDGVYRNRRDAILGADDKAGVAVMLEAARRWAASGAPCGCELVFTTGEEVGLRGAHAFDTGVLGAEFGFVLDHAAPIGRIVVAAPTYYAVYAEFLGRAAHAGIRPEDGRSAIAAAAKAVESLRLGRLDEETTANVGVIHGGVAANVVPERCVLEAEVRSLDDAKASEAVRAMVDTITWAASATETDVDTTIEEHFRAYRIPESDPTVLIASAALRDCGVEPLPTSTGGGSDASAFAAKGLRCLNLAIGAEDNHTPDERISEAALEKVLDITLRLLERSARHQ
jgi:tripeptide aminopeptidase